MRLIDADELEHVVIGKHYGVNAIEYFIKMQHTVDAMPVNHGRWEDLICSVCGNLGWDYEDAYCPNCGARMDGDKSE